MPSDHERLESLKRAVATANPIGFVAILTRDLRWLIEQAEGKGESRSELSAPNSPLSVLDIPETPDDPELN